MIEGIKKKENRAFAMYYIDQIVQEASFCTIPCNLYICRSSINNKNKWKKLYYYQLFPKFFQLILEAVYLDVKEHLIIVRNSEIASFLKILGQKTIKFIETNHGVKQNFLKKSH